MSLHLSNKAHDAIVMSQNQNVTVPKCSYRLQIKFQLYIVFSYIIANDSNLMILVQIELL